MKARFNIYRILGGGYYFIFKNADGKKVFTSKPYPGIIECKHGIYIMKIPAGSGSYNEELIIRNKQYCFILKNMEGELLGRSENYLSSISRNEALQELKRDAPLALAMDFT